MLSVHSKTQNNSNSAKSSRRGSRMLVRSASFINQTQIKIMSKEEVCDQFIEADFHFNTAK